jgi:dTDP-glucose 4,6-dehydratase
MRILITGAAGFIGSHFTEQLVNTGKYEIVVVDSLSYAGRMRNLESVISSVNFIQLDIRDREALLRVFQEKSVEIVVNFAAESHVDRSISDPEVFLSTNVSGTLNLLNLSRDFQVSKFLQISTDEVYGSIESGLSREDSPFNPSSPYSASKASAEHFVNSYFTTFGLHTGIVRCSNNYGPRQFPEKLIPVAIKALKEGRNVPVYGSGLNTREWIHVEDCASGILSVLEKGKPGEAYNISSGEFSSNLELVNRLIRLLGREETAISFVNDRLGHDFRYAIDSSKVRNELGWKPRIDFEDGIKSTVEWYLENQWAL